MVSAVVMKQRLLVEMAGLYGVPSSFLSNTLTLPL